MSGKRRGRGEGSIEQLPSGKFRVVISAGKAADGKRQKLTFTADKKKEVLAWMRQKQGEAVNGQITNAGKMTVAEWLNRWLELKKPNVAGKTYDHDEGRVRNHLIPALGTVPLSRLTALHVEKVLADMATAGHSTSERFKAGAILRSALSHAIRVKLLAFNVAKDVKLPKVVRPEKVCLDHAQATALLMAARSHRLGALFDVALDLGPRPGELYALHWPDFDRIASTIFIHRSLEERKGHLRLKETKTPRSRRRIKLAPRTLAALEAHRQRMREEGRDVQSGLIFPDTEGGFLRQSNFLRRVLRPLLKRAGLAELSFRPYDLRHTCATLLLSRDVNIRVVSERLGHESIELTLTHYAHALPDMQQRAADAVESMFGPIVPPVSHGERMDAATTAASA